MKRFLLLLASAVTLTMQAQTVQMVWPLGSTDGLDACVKNGDDAYTGLVTTRLSVGSQLTVSGVMTSSSADEGFTAITYDAPFTKFQPASKVTAKNGAHQVTYSLSVSEGHSFKPTKLSFDAAHVGTDKGNVDVYYKIGNEAEVLVGSDVTPARNKVQNGNATAYSNHAWTYSDLIINGGDLTVILYVYNVDTNKEIAFRNLSIEGIVDEPVYNLSYYLKSCTCSAGDLMPFIGELSTGGVASFPGQLSSDPTDFQVEAIDGYTATITYANQAATVKVFKAETEIYSVRVFFTLDASAIHHGTATPLNRGLLPIKVSGGVFVSWRYRQADNGKYTYRLLRNGTKVVELKAKTNYTDTNGGTGSLYSLEVLDAEGTVVERQDNVKVWSDQTFRVYLQTPVCKRLACSYTPNDCSAYDMDGDGEVEIIVKWDPDNSKDSAGSGQTSDVIIDCYKLDGTLLWRINLGQNIRAGAHYTTFLCYDFDGDGFGEMMVKTAPGTIDGLGNYVIKDGADPSVSYVNGSGKITSGPEWVSVFDGVTGQVMGTADYYPKYGDEEYGDSKMNRSDRYKACVAFLDGLDKNPLGVFNRGYYNQSYFAAYRWDGSVLTEHWRQAYRTKGQGLYGTGAHSVTVGDVDGDGKDEVVVGSGCMDDDGSCLWRLSYGHGDATHMGDFNWDNPGMEVYMVYEDVAQDWTLADAATGKIIAGVLPPDNTDTGRGIAMDCDDRHEGAEFFDSHSASMYDQYGRVICPWHEGTTSASSINFRIYWNGTLYDDYHDRGHIDTWDSRGQSWGRTTTLSNLNGGASSINSTKYNPNLQCDLFGDWREEVVYWGSDDNGQYLNIIATVIPTDWRLPYLRDDHVYDMAIAWQNSGYNQPPHLSYSPVLYWSVEKASVAELDNWVPYYTDKKQTLPEGVEMWYVRSYSTGLDEDTVHLEKFESDIIPAGKGFLLKTASDTIFRTLPTEENVTVSMSPDRLSGTDQAGTVKSELEELTYYNYEFRNDDVHGLGFYLIGTEGVAMDAHTSYLHIYRSKVFTPSPYYLLSAGTSSAISTVRHDSNKPKEWYDLSGRRVLQPTRGFYICNGERIFLK